MTWTDHQDDYPLPGPARVMGLRETLEAATPGEWKAEDGSTYLAGRGWWVDGPETLSHDGDLREADARLIALAPELAQLALDMGEEARGLSAYLRAIAHDGLQRYEEWADSLDALLARLDQLGKEQT